MAQHDDLGFVPQPHADLGFVAGPPPGPSLNNTSGFESLARGAAQGATFGFQDEVSPLIEKAIGTVMQNPAYEGKSIADLRNTYREQNQEAAKTNPKSYLLGNVLGGLSSTLPLTGIGAGTEIGALSSLPRTLAPAARGLGAYGALGAESTAGRLFTLQGLKTLGINAAKNAVEGGIIGAVSGAGYADKDKLEAAKKGGTTNALIGLGMGAFGKPILDQTAKLASKTIQAAQGLPNEALDYIKNNPGELDSIRAAALNKNDAIAGVSHDLADKIGESLDGIVRSKNEIIDSAVAASGDTPINLNNVISKIDSKLGDLRKGGVTAPAKEAISFLENLKKDISNKYSALDEGGVRGTAEEINILRKELNDVASSSYNAKLKQGNPVIAKMAGSVADEVRNSLDVVSADIRSANADLKQVIDLRKDISKKFSAPSLLNKDNVVDPADVQKILTRMPSESKASDKYLIKNLGDLTGLDLDKTSSWLQTVKAIDSEGSKMASKYPTGRYSLPLAAGGALGTLVGAYEGKDAKHGLIGGALGTLLGLGLGSKAAIPILLNNEAIRGGAQNVLDIVRRNIAAQGNGAQTIEFTNPSVITPGGHP